MAVSSCYCAKRYIPGGSHERYRSRDRDDAFRKMIQAFEQKMIAVHGFTFEEARMVTQGNCSASMSRRALPIV
jgi:hypothetical protein